MLSRQDAFSAQVSGRTLESQAFRAQVRWWIWFVVMSGVTALVGLFMMSITITMSTAAWLIYFSAVIAILLRPRMGIYMIVPLAIMGDRYLTTWWPFSLNFSSPESLLFVSEALIFSPLETFLVFTLMSWMWRLIFKRGSWGIRTGPLFFPMGFFALFVVIGLGYGVLNGGKGDIALWQVRPILYMPLMGIMTINLMEERKHITTLMWLIMAGIAFEGISGTVFFATVMNYSIAGYDSITQHPAAIHHNTMFVFWICTWLYKVSWPKRLLLTAAMPFVGLTYIATQRRAAFVAMAIALVLLVVFMYRENKQLFKWMAPAAAVLGVVYLLVFWNSSGALGLPAQAIKSVISEDKRQENDLQSNIYRDLENLNIWYTIRTSPIFGVGFDNKFLITAPMADISFFDWWEYFTHNSIAWIWMYAGFGGFFFVLYTIGMVIMTGVRVIWRMPGSEITAVTVTAILYIVMHFIFAYVDMSWAAQSMVYVGAMVGVIGSVERVMEVPVPLPEKRWRWQADPEPAPVLESIKVPS